MSGGAPKLRDAGKLADSRAVFELDLPLVQLPGLPPEFAAGGGVVRARLSFGRERGFAMAQVDLDAELTATCQRCLSGMALHVKASSPVLIVESERQSEDAPAGWETFLAPEGRVEFAALVAEELLLALPIVPLHETPEQCAPLVAAAPRPLAAEVDRADSSSEAATTRPFADLRTLLEGRSEVDAGSRDTRK